MRNLTTLALAFAAFAVLSMSVSSAHAQSQNFNRGFGFGAGFGFGQGQGGFNRSSGNRRGGFGPVLNFGGRIGFSERIQEPPFFAKYPPVYYSHIVPRPYGISPFAAPPGIAPIELNTPGAVPLTIDNPFLSLIHI